MENLKLNNEYRKVKLDDTLAIKRYFEIVRR